LALGAWQLDPLPLAAGAGALVLYGRGFLRLRRRRRSLAKASTAVSFVSGVLVAVLAVVSPLDTLGENRLLTAHMAQHLLLGDLAPVLLVLGIRSPMAFFALPPSILGPLARNGAVRKVIASVLRPMVTLGLWVAVVYLWHVPALYDAALESVPLHALEHGLFVLVGLLVWMQILDPGRRGHLAPGGRALFAVGVLLAGMPLAEIMIAAGPLYPHYAALTNRPFGWSAGADQTHAALAMMAEQVATLVTAAALLLWQHLEELDPAPVLTSVAAKP